jgi:hypothetical protein
MKIIRLFIMNLGKPANYAHELIADIIQDSFANPKEEESKMTSLNTADRKRTLKADRVGDERLREN